MAAARGGWRGPTRALTMAAAAAPATGREKDRHHFAANHKAAWGPSCGAGLCVGLSFTEPEGNSSRRGVCVPEGTLGGDSSVSRRGKAQLCDPPRAATLAGLSLPCAGAAAALALPCALGVPPLVTQGCCVTRKATD